MARQNVAPTEPKAIITADSFANFNARLGANATNLQGGATYVSQRYRTRNYVILEAMYRGSGLVRKAIDAVADHMVRKGIEFTSTANPDTLDPLTNAFDDLGIWDSIGDGLRWGRLYGGALNVMLIDGQSLESPLNPDTIAKDQFKGLHTLDRWQVQPSQEIVTEYGPHFGLPVSYRINADGNPLGGKTVHYSRVLRYPGARLPFRERLYEQGWDSSFVEVWFDRLINLDTVTAGTAQLVHKAHLRTITIKDLRSIIAAGGVALDGVLKQVETMRITQTLEGVTLLDSQDKFEAVSYAFSGLDKVLSEFKEDLAAVTETPMAIMFGQSPGGMNSTGDVEMDTWIGMLEQKQESGLRRPLGQLLPVMYRSSIGRAPEAGFGFNFRDLNPMSEDDKSKIFSQDVTSIAKLESSGVISRAMALAELKGLSEITGRGTKITDADITEAENDPPELQPGYVPPAIETVPGGPKPPVGAPAPAPAPSPAPARAG